MDKDFMNRLWNSTGKQITGSTTQSRKFHGLIINTRAKAGIDVELQVKDLDTGEIFLVSGLDVWNAERDLMVYDD